MRSRAPRATFSSSLETAFAFTERYAGRGDCEGAGTAVEVVWALTTCVEMKTDRCFAASSFSLRV
jgi:hypothetical protein